MQLNLTIAELEAVDAAITQMNKIATQRITDQLFDHEQFDAHKQAVMYAHLASKVQSLLHIGR